MPEITPALTNGLRLKHPGNCSADIKARGQKSRLRHVATPGLLPVLFLLCLAGLPDTSPSSLNALLIPAASGQTADKEPAAKKAIDPSGESRDQSEEENPSDRLSEFARLLRIGQTSRNIMIPAVERGSMTSLTRAEALTRRSEDYLDLLELVIQFYTADGEKDTRLITPHAEFHLPSGILFSERRTLVSRSDFDLEGDRFAFDTNSRRGRFEGNVTMIIHSTERFRGDDSLDEPIEPSTPAETPPRSSPNSEPESPDPAEPETAGSTDQPTS